MSPEIKANLEAQFGLDDPIWLQYVHYLNNLLHGNFGPSYNLPDFTVGELFANGLPISIQLGAAGADAGAAGRRHARHHRRAQPEQGRRLRRHRHGDRRQHDPELRHRAGDPACCSA